MALLTLRHRLISTGSGATFPFVDFQRVGGRKSHLFFVCLQKFFLWNLPSCDVWEFLVRNNIIKVRQPSSTFCCWNSCPLCFSFTPRSIAELSKKSGQRKTKPGFQKLFALIYLALYRRIYLLERVRYTNIHREKVKEKWEKNILSPVNSQGWGRLKSGVRNPIKVSYMNNRDTRTWIIICCLLH